ncbi:nuclear transport factor 2 family protein (plasmid) [Rhizobium beringeri]|uniref:YybH family protein n=1 Tax=Rhizobium beringeri TaxID=3019934 RepID=UPI002E156826|nr:nuclear transport factor 2 family protein [Rhizobium beringeri]
MHPQDHMKLYEASVNLRRFDEVAPLISAEAVFWFTDGTYRGIDAIKAAFEETWRKLHNEVYWLEDVDWIAVGDTVASCTYRFRWRADIDGKTYEGDGRGTTILRKEDTQWKIVHEHLSRFPK